MTPEPDSIAAPRPRTDMDVPLLLRVLVVDDNREAADTTAELLAIYGADTDVRYSGDDAIADIVALQPDACVLDLTMPGMDGFELATRIRALHGRQPLLVALTALGDYNTLDKEVKSGFDLHFTKPVDPAELVRELREHVIRMGCPI